MRQVLPDDDHAVAGWGMRIGRFWFPGYGWVVRSLFFVGHLLGMAVAAEEIEELPALLVLGERETEDPKARSWSAGEIAEAVPLTIARLLIFRRSN